MFFGEVNCSRCPKKAYYQEDDHPRCGRHSDATKRKTLKKRPKHDTQARDWDLIEKAKGPGLIECAKRGLFSIPKKDGFISIFPNYRAKGDNTSLSPMRLGPVLHGQPGLPSSLNLENFHQGNKCFPKEVDEFGDPLPSYYEKRLEMYLDPIPHRHKFEKKDLPVGNANKPFFSIFVLPDGTPQRYSYIESRYFYCHFYEILAKQTNAYAELVRQHEAGYNLLIIGYDGKEITSLQRMYEDESSPFGHELVLCSLLLLKPEEYPWNIYHREHREIYP